MQRLILALAVLATTLCPAQGILRLLAGGGSGTFCGDGGAAAQACLNQPSGLAIDSFNNLYIADTANHRIRKVTPGGVISTVAGNGIQGYSGDNLSALVASLNQPTGVAIGAAGRLYILDSGNSRVRSVGTNGIITTIAGTGTPGFSGDNGPAAQAQINPLAGFGGLALDRNGNLYLTDTGNHRVRVIGSSGIIFTIAGNGTAGLSGDGGPASAAMLNLPSGSVTFDGAGNCYIPDSKNNRVRMINSSAVINTVAGSGSASFSGDGGPPTAGTLNNVLGLAGDNNILNGIALYIADYGNNRVRRVTPTATAFVMNTVAGGGSAATGVDGLSSTNIALSGPTAVLVDNSGNLLIADALNKRVLKVLAPTAIASGPLTASPTQLGFSAISGGDQPDTQTVQLSGPDLSAYSYAATVTTSSGGSWLSVSPSLGRTPASLRVKVDPGNLPAGTYQGTINLTAPQATTAPTISVGFTVAAAPPVLTVSHEVLRFSAIAGAPSPLGLHLRIGNSGGGGPLNWTATAATLNGGNWLTPAIGNGTTPSALQVLAGINGLTPGIYQGSLTIRAGTLTKVIRAVLSLVPPTTALRLSETGVVFTAVAGAGALPAHTLSVANGAIGTMDWKAQVNNPAGGSWLTATPTSGSSSASQTPATLSLTANATNLAAGTYHAIVRVSAQGAANSPAFVTVILNVLPAGSSAPLRIAPAGLLFQTAQGGNNPAPQTLAVSTGGRTAASFAVSASELDGRDWLEVSPASGSIAVGAATAATVTVDSSGLTAGAYAGIVNVVLTDGTVRSASVVLLVRPVDTAANGEPPPAATCGPKALVPIQTGQVNNFQAQAGWPSSLRALVTDDCGNLVDTATVVTSFSNSEAPVVLVNVKNGQYAGTWQPGPNASTAPVTITTTAMAAGLQTGVSKVSGTASANAVPQVYPNGAVQAASFTPLAPLSPGSIFSMFGANLNPKSAAAANLPLPNLLDQVSATIGDQNVPLYFAGAGQVNAQVPYEVAPGSTATLVVKVGNQYAVPQNISFSTVQPGIFTVNQSGTGAGTMLDVAFRLVSEANPVKPGDVVQIYCTGLGTTTPAAITGDKPALPILNYVETPVTATVDGASAIVDFAGISPGFVGLYQVNLRIPATARDGALPLVLTQTGIPSNEVTVQVKKQ